MENIRLKVLAGFKLHKSANHLSKIYSLSLDQVLEWKRMDRKTLIQLLHRSGTKADAPDYKLGYGRPQTEKLVEMLK